MCVCNCWSLSFLFALCGLCDGTATCSSEQACEIAAEDALRKGQSVVVDRCNFDYQQRHVWIQMATKFNVARIDAIHFGKRSALLFTEQLDSFLHADVPVELCKARVLVREDHPTIPKGGGEFYKNILFPCPWHFNQF